MRTLFLLVLVACSDNDPTTPSPDGDTDPDADPDTDTDGGVVTDCPADGLPGVLDGTITTDMTLGPECDWFLAGETMIGDDASETVLTILPGTVVQGAIGSFLAIARGSKILADGTAAEPIVFTSDDAVKARGQWGGVVLNGRAPINSGAEEVGAGGRGVFGGTDPADDSGVLRYVRIEYGGGDIDNGDEEVNGLTLAGVGSTTVIDYVQAHATDHDAFEFEGGAAQAKHLISTCTNSDGIDWDIGFTGKIQFALVAGGCDEAGNEAIEGSSNDDDEDALPRSSPTLSNVTLVGFTGGSDPQVGIVLQEGTDATITNTIVAIDGICLVMKDDETFAAGPDIDHTILDCPTLYETGDAGDVDQEEEYISEGIGNSTHVDPQLVDPIPAGDPNYAPALGSPAASGGESPPDPFFVPATYLGAFDPAGPDWSDGWTHHEL